MSDTNLVIGGKEFSSRLIVGTGKYSSMEVMKQAHEASGAQIITVALRRVNELVATTQALVDRVQRGEGAAGVLTSEQSTEIGRAHV